VNAIPDDEAVPDDLSPYGGPDLLVTLKDARVRDPNGKWVHHHPAAVNSF
jgi:hypothetical protein